LKTYRDPTKLGLTGKIRRCERIYDVSTQREESFQGEEEVTTLRTSSTAICVLVAAITMGMLPCAVWGGEPERPALELLSVGQPKPSAIGLRLWTNKEPGQAIQEGDRLIVTVQADRNAYLTALCISAEGNVTILFPGRETRDSLLEKGKPYTLFGDDSELRLKLVKKIDTPRLVFYVSAKRPTLDSFKLSKQTGLVTIAGDSGAEIKALKEALEAVAGEEGFNRILPSATGDGKEYFEVKLTEGPGRLMGGARPIQKKLPTSVDSTPPETVTGVQGVKPESPK
jgi:hypothetical protein